MRLLSVGGGSGGHVTPVLALINELSALDSELTVHFVCDKAFETQSRGIMQHALVDVQVSTIAAGKLRRYHDETKIQKLLDIKTNAKNIRDVSNIGVGFLQSILLIRRFKPDVVFAKGGYVCLPLGYAAKLLGVPIVIHDSDTRPGLTNRLLGRFAQKIATGSPVENYSYDPKITTYTGVPVDAAFRPVSAKEQLLAKQEIGVVDDSKPLLVVVGGGLGAKSINTGLSKIAVQLADAGFAVYHVTGKSHEETVRSAIGQELADYHIVPFVYKNMQQVLGAADIVISRASATFLQELAALKKPTIVVPAAQLSDQVKNAEVYKKASAVVIVEDHDAKEGVALLDAVVSLTADPHKTIQMSERFHEFARPDAARDVARMIADVAARKHRS